LNNLPPHIALANEQLTRIALGYLYDELEYVDTTGYVSKRYRIAALRKQIRRLQQ